MYAAIAVERGCGRRTKGGAYMECGVGYYGSPVESFLVDPPISISKQELGLSDVGVKLIERDGAWHVLDIIGREYYPNIADYVEEVRRYGASRRLPTTLEFSKLTNESTMILAHQRAWIAKPEPYYLEWFKVTPRNITYCPCPKKFDGHELFVREFDLCKNAYMCAGLFWNDVEGGEPTGVEIDEDPHGPRRVIRHMPSFSYDAATRPAGVTPQYGLAIFMRLPITRLVVVSDDGSNTEKRALERASKASIPLDLVEE